MSRRLHRLNRRLPVRLRRTRFYIFHDIFTSRGRATLYDDYCTWMTRIKDLNLPCGFARAMRQYVQDMQYPTLHDGARPKMNGSLRHA
jgi:hypothetical protein